MVTMQFKLYRTKFQQLKAQDEPYGLEPFQRNFLSRNPSCIRVDRSRVKLQLLVDELPTPHLGGIERRTGGKCHSLSLVHLVHSNDGFRRDK